MIKKYDQDALRGKQNNMHTAQYQEATCMQTELKKSLVQYYMDNAGLSN